MTTSAALVAAPRSPTALPTNAPTFSGSSAMTEAPFSIGSTASRRLLVPAQVVAEHSLGVLGLVAIRAQVLPVAAVGRVVVVVAVLVVDGEQVKVRQVELSGAACADPSMQRKRARAIVESAAAGLLDDRVDGRRRQRLAAFARSKAPSRHRRVYFFGSTSAPVFKRSAFKRMNPSASACRYTLSDSNVAMSGR